MEGERTRGVQHLADGACHVGGVALDDEFEAIVGDDGDVFRQLLVRHRVKSAVVRVNLDWRSGFSEA